MALYGSVPFIMGHKKYNSVGVLMMNAAEMWVDVERSTSSNNVKLLSLESFLIFCRKQVHMSIG
jgi:mannosyl-oligosaccharide alpha-1,3-glucosidase